MTIDGFLTFLGLAAAVFAIIPPVARLRIRLQLGVQIALGATAVAMALYFEFFDFVALPCPSILGGVCPLLQMPGDSKFTPEMAAFIVVLVWMVLAFFAATLLPPSQRSLGPMAELLERLFHQDRYGEAVDFVLPHLGFIDRAQNRGLWTQRTHDWLAGNRIVDVEALLAERKKANRLGDARRFLRPLAKLFPSGNHAQENAERILNSMYLTRQFMEYVALQRPSVAGMLVTLDARQRCDFSNRLLHSLMSVPGSRLYEELEQNAKYDGIGDGLVVGHNFILRAYFGNARVAELLGAWKPVGDYVISEIRRADRAKLNGRSDDFDKNRWSDPIAVGVAYFDLMIRSAFSQNIDDSMWLAYLDHFVDELEQVYNAGGDTIDVDAEFPTWASRLIYEIVDILGGWVALSRKAPANSPHRAFPGSLHVGSSSIPANAARSLGTCLRHILRSERIGDSFAMYMVECVIRDLKYLVQPEDKAARRFLIKSIVTGGGFDGDLAYGTRLAHLMSGIDHVLIYDVQDLVEAAQLAFPSLGFEK